MASTPSFLCPWTRQTTFKTSAVSGPIPNAAIGKQSAKKEICFMSGTTATTVVNHRSQEVLLLHFGATVFSCLRGVPTLCQLRFCLHQLPQLLPSRAILKMFHSVCQSVSNFRLNASVQGLEVNIKRYMHSHVTHVPVRSTSPTITSSAPKGSTASQRFRMMRWCWISVGQKSTLSAHQMAVPADLRTGFPR